MNTEYPAAAEQIRLAREYFTKVDAGDTSILEMFTDDVQGYFPKFGIAHGKAELVQLIGGLNDAVLRYAHPPESFVFTQAGNRLVVEGTESGVLTGGASFPAGARSEGRSCNVFACRGNLVCQLHIYAGPDYAGRHNDSFPA